MKKINIKIKYVSIFSISKVEQQKQQRMRELEDMQKKLKEFDSHLETARNDLIQVKSDLARKREDESSLRTELDQISRKIGELSCLLQNRIALTLTLQLTKTAVWQRCVKNPAMF